MTRLCFLLVAATAGLYAQATNVADLWVGKEVERLHAIDEKLNGVLGVSAIDLTARRTSGYNSNAVFPTASSIKIAIMTEVFRQAREGKFKMDDKVALGPADYAGGSGGPVQEALKNGPITVTVRELIDNMIEHSDNSATNKLISMAGMDNVNDLLNRVDLHATRLRRKMMDSAAAARGDENVSTPFELARLLEMLYNGTIADPRDCHEMVAILKKVHEYMRPVIPAEIEVASKPGELDGVRCEAGIVFLPKRPFVVVVMSTFLDDNVNPVGEATRVVFDYFNKLAHSNEYGRRLN